MHIESSDVVQGWARKPDRAARPGGRLVRHVGVAFSFALLLASNSPAVALQMNASDATVSNPGRTATICVSLESDGQQVAGTQNDLVWDGNCLTLEGCQSNGSHGKSLTCSDPRAGEGADVTLHCLALSIADVNPIPDGSLYCCDFISELSDAGSCDVQVVNVLGADPEGRRVPGTGSAGMINFSKGGDGDGGCQLVSDGPSGWGPIVTGLLALAGLTARRRR